MPNNITPDTSGITMSTRVRLARNLKGYPFPGRMQVGQKIEVTQRVQQAFLQSGSYIAENFYGVNLEDIGENERISLVERHLVSPEFISDIGGRGLLLSRDQKVSIMINEEDHLRIQVISPSLEEAFEMADRIDSVLTERLEIAFDRKLGYLTQCPTNLGTGMRASLMLHLPALHEAGAMGRISANLAKLGITVRGSYGEGTEILGAIYQISNQITLGLSELEAIENLSSIAQQLIEEEKRAQQEAVKNIFTLDKISRALGLLKEAMVLPGREYIALSSLVGLGISAGVLQGITIKQLNGLSTAVQPATLAVTAQATDSRQRDACRARLVRDTLRAATMKY